MGVFVIALLVHLAACQPLWAGGIRGKMYNLPQRASLEPIPAAETIQIRVTKFNTNEAIPLRDENGKSLPLSPGTQDGRVDFRGANFAFTLPRSDTTKDSQAVTIQFFRANAPGSLALPTQRLLAVIIADDKGAFLTLDVSVPLPSEMEGAICEPYVMVESDCQLRWRMHGRRGLIRR